MLTRPRGPVSQRGCVSGARAVPCTAVLSNLIYLQGNVMCRRGLSVRAQSV
ncbi:hypothetical protein IEO21_09787 [Rhodonia placenta]|uniref:Uncharacterized protein n=1 Tax=Rhodonia placenta TaxID=104341 RepID=A0A8H7NRB1_9APHY|nr:hypothetical protein IEO21_11041 [Postia placenta]KAF9800348.1 hypothetical protein IEO21_10381 [Postia placenta]KAF9802948.1 hypothetical protein IEO21_09787 [Postia placenta]